MKNKFIAVVLSLIIMPFFAIQVKAEKHYEFSFERTDGYILGHLQRIINSARLTQKYGLEYTSDDIENAIQYTEYYSPKFFKYTDGSFKTFLEEYADGEYCRFEICTSKYPESAYQATIKKEGKNYRISLGDYTEDYWADGYEKNYICNNIERTASKYTDGGKVYICQYDWIYIGIVCDKNDIPKYVICHDSHYNFGKKSEEVTTDNKEIKELLDTFDTLYNSYDWKVYDDNEHQYVFDFDFFVDVDKAIHGTLPDDYVFEPHGLESMAKNTIKTIDGRAYRFSKNGVCTGLYTGWSNTKNGKRFFRRGELVTGKTTINGKEYEFDKNGYLK